MNPEERILAYQSKRQIGINGHILRPGARDISYKHTYYEEKPKNEIYTITPKPGEEKPQNV